MKHEKNANCNASQITAPTLDPMLVFERTKAAGAVAVTVPGAGLFISVHVRLRLRTLVEAALKSSKVSCVLGQEAEFACQVERVAAVLSAGHLEAYSTCMSRVIHNLMTAADVVVAACPLSAIPRVSHVQLQDTASASLAATRGPLAPRVADLLADAAAAAAEASLRAANVTVATAISCPNCKTQDRIVRVLRQSRAADEGMATQCLCMACNRSWRLA